MFKMFIFVSDKQVWVYVTISGKLSQKGPRLLCLLFVYQKTLLFLIITFPGRKVSTRCTRLYAVHNLFACLSVFLGFINVGDRGGVKFWRQCRRLVSPPSVCRRGGAAMRPAATRRLAHPVDDDYVVVVADRDGDLLDEGEGRRLSRKCTIRTAITTNLNGEQK